LIKRGIYLFKNPPSRYSANLNANERESMSTLLYKEISYEIQGACFTAWNNFRNAFKESIIENALVLEMEKRGLWIERQKRIDIYYKEKKVGAYVPDIVIEDLILFELKRKPYPAKQDIQQFWYYMKSTEYKVGYLVNFGDKKKNL